MLFGVFLTLGVAVFSIGLRSFQNSYLQKAGALGILVATYLAVYFISGSWIWGLAAATGNFSGCFTGKKIERRPPSASMSSMIFRFIICAFRREPEMARLGQRGIIRSPTA